MKKIPVSVAKRHFSLSSRMNENNIKMFEGQWRKISTSLLVLFMLFFSGAHANAQRPKIDEKLVDTFCEGAKNESLHVLYKLFLKSTNTPNLTLESYKEVFNEAIAEDLTRLRARLSGRKNASQEINLFIASSEINYKFALCEKFRRPTALPVTIATENYLHCRRGIVDGNDTRPPPCF